MYTVLRGFGQKYSSLPRGISSANDNEFLGLAHLRFDKRCAVVNSNAFKPRQVLYRELPIFRPRGDHDGAGRRSGDPFSQFDHIRFTIAGKLRSIGEQHLRPELLRLYISARCQIVSGNPRWKAEVVFDVRAGAGLAAGRICFQKQDFQPFGSTIHRGSQACWSSTHDHQIMHMPRIHGLIETEAIGDLLVRSDYAARLSPRQITTGISDSAIWK
jgi:hypothetical protein